jgi:hypothetical protein
MVNLSEDQIKEIAQDIDMGMKCYWNKKTGEIITVPDELRNSFFDEDQWKDEFKKVRQQKKNLVEIEGMSSHDSFRIMEDFLDEIPDNTRLKVSLIEALNKRKPFANFKSVIIDSEYSDSWYAFKDRRMVEWVKEQLPADLIA